MKEWDVTLALKSHAEESTRMYIEESDSCPFKVVMVCAVRSGQPHPHTLWSHGPPHYAVSSSPTHLKSLDSLG